MENTAWEVQYSLNCKASRPYIWAFLTNLTNWERLEGKSVTWIRIYGPFEPGTNGETKMPGQMPQRWVIAAVEKERSMLIEAALEGATFYTRTELEVINPAETRIIRTMSLAGPKASEMASAMEAFEKNAPQGLAKLVELIEKDFAENRNPSE